MIKKRTNINIPELLAPAGNWAMLKTAVNSGADAVYFGVSGFNMRATAKNFELKDIEKITKFCHENRVKAYLAVNIVIYENELKKLKKILKKAKKSNIDAIIAWDFSVIKEAKKIGLDIHISTQASISNSESANFYKKIGAKRCVLAREVTLEHLKKIKKNTEIKIEVFGHGAMCVSISGRCFISQYLYGKSANRGNCIQPCRRAYDKILIKDKEEDKELLAGNDYIMSPKDLCTMPFLDKIVPYIDSLKIEGRARSPEYVEVVVSSYREALDAIAEKRFTKKLIQFQMEQLKTVFNRDFSEGFYMGKPIKDFTNTYGSKAKKRKHTLGIVKNYFRKINVAELEIRANKLKKGDEIIIIGPSTGCVRHIIDSMEINHRTVQDVEKGKSVAIKIPFLVRKNDEVFLWK